MEDALRFCYRAPFGSAVCRCRRHCLFSFRVVGIRSPSFTELERRSGLPSRCHFLCCKLPRYSTETNWVGWILWAAICFLVVFEVAARSAAPTSRDELTHHLAIPKLYANAGRIVEVPMAPNAYYPMLLIALYPMGLSGIQFRSEIDSRTFRLTHGLAFIRLFEPAHESRAQVAFMYDPRILRKRCCT